MGTANSKTTIDTDTHALSHTREKKKKQSKHNTKDGHQTTGGKNKRGM